MRIELKGKKKNQSRYGLTVVPSVRILRKEMETDDLAASLAFKHHWAVGLLAY